jgi:hypothetical protein
MIPINNVEELINHLQIIYPTIDDPNLTETLSESDKELAKIVDSTDFNQLSQNREEMLAHILQKIQEHNNLS